LVTIDPISPDLITRMFEDEEAPGLDNSSKNTTSSTMNDTMDSKLEHFHKLGDVIERQDETGLMQVESLCMHCHENVHTILISKHVKNHSNI
jgi:hypothetical protein